MCVLRNGSDAKISGTAPRLELVMCRYSEDVERSLRSWQERISHCIAYRDGCFTAKMYGTLWCSFSWGTIIFSLPDTIK